MNKKHKEEQPQQESPSFFKELGCFMRPYKNLYAISVIISILGVGIGLGAYAFAGLIAADLFSGKPSHHIWLFVAGAVICRLLHGVLINVSTQRSHHAAYLTLRDLRLALSEKLMKMPLGYFETQGSGRLTMQLTEEIENMEKPLAHVLPELTGNLLAPALLLIWLFIIDWRLGLCTLLWIIAGFSVTGGMMRNYPEKFAGQLNAAKTMNQSITEYINGIEVIKNFGQAKSCGQKYESAVYGHADYNVGWQKETQVYSALGMAIAPFSIFPVLIAGLIFFSRGTLDAPTLFLAVLLTMGIFGPLMNTMVYFDQLAQMGTLAKELKTILDYPELTRGNGSTPIDASISFNHVDFAYDDAKGLALKDINLHVPAGTMLALVGPSGSGKSTIARLLAGYWNTKAGKISIGGVPLTDFTQEQLNQLIAYVDQDTFLFDKSIADNIRIGMPDASDDAVQEAAKKVGCDAFIRALPDGYQTMAGTAGNRLSGGQRQRIAIARAMMKNAPILILDEATASADPENEALIQSALSAAAKDKTLIVVAHHLTTIVHANQIAFVNDGHIQDIGTHAELLEKCPGYKALWTLSKEG